MAIGSSAADITNLVDAIDDNVKDVYSHSNSLSHAASRLNAMNLMFLHQCCAENPNAAVSKFNLPPDVVEAIGRCGPEFALLMQPLTDHMTFDLSRNADMFRRVLSNPDTMLQNAFFQVGKQYSDAARIAARNAQKEA